jgi:hypothetical protein
VGVVVVHAGLLPDEKEAKIKAMRWLGSRFYSRRLPHPRNPPDLNPQGSTPTGNSGTGGMPRTGSQARQPRYCTTEEASSGQALPNGPVRQPDLIDPSM